MADAAALDAAAARELHEERERCHKMKQENQVLLKKLHDVVGRYRQLQQQYQTMVNERQEHQQQLHDAAGAVISGAVETDAKSSAMGGGESPTNHGSAAEDAALKKLETEKHELIEKLKQVVGTCRIMQKQLQEAKEENEALKSPAKPMLAGSNHDATEALQVRVIALEREVAQKEEEKEEIVGKLKEVISRYQSLQKQLEDKICEHDAAMTKVAALEMELRSQQSASSSSSSGSWIRRSSGGSNGANSGSTDQQLQAKEKEIAKLKEDVQKLSVAMTQEEARTAVFREENARLKEQVTSIMQETQQQEQNLRDENISFSQQIAELQRQAELMEKQQEDSEHLYMEVASKLNHTLRENGDLQRRLASLQQSVQEAEQLREHATSEHAAHIARLEEQLSAAEAAKVNSSVHEDHIAELKLQIEQLTVSESRLVTLESELAHHGVGTAHSSIAELLQAKEHSHQEEIGASSRQVEELRSQLEATSDLESTLSSLREQVAEQLATIAKLQEELEHMTEERDAALESKESELGSLQAAHDQETSRLREQIERLESQLGNTNESASLVEQQRNDLRLQLEAAANEVATKNQALFDEQKRVAELENKLHDAQNAADEAKRLFDESVETNEVLRKTIAEGKAAFGQLKCEFADAEARHGQVVTTRVEELEAQLMTKVATVEELMCELENVRAQLEEAVVSGKSAAEAERAKLDAATARNKELEETVTKLKEQLSEVHASMEQDQQIAVSQLNGKIAHLESEIRERDARLSTSMDEIEQLKVQLSALRHELTTAQTYANEKQELMTAHTAAVSSLQQQLADNLTEYEEKLKEKVEKLEKAEVEIASLQTQLMTWEAKQQSDADSIEVVNDLRERAASLQSECESARKGAEQLQEEKIALEERVTDLQGHLERTRADKDAELDDLRAKLEREVQRLRREVDTLQEELISARRESDAYAQQVERIQGQLTSLSLIRREVVGEDSQKPDDGARVCMDQLLEDLRTNLTKAEEYERQMSEVASATSTLRDQLASATTDMSLAESRCASYEAEIRSLNEQVETVRDENERLAAKIEAMQSDLSQRSEIIESLKAENASKEEQKIIQLNERIAELTATVTDTENELAAIKAENTRMVFEVAKTTDSAVKLKQDYDQVQAQHKSKCDEAESLQLLVHEMESRSGLLVQDVQEKSRLIDQLQEELSSLQESTAISIQELQTRLAEADVELAHLSDEISNKSGANEHLQSELEALKAAEDEMKRLEEELTKSKERVESMLEQKRDLIEQISIGNSERAALADELSLLQSSTTERISLLESKNHALESELQATNDELERTQEEKRTIGEQLKTLENELEAKTAEVRTLTEQVTLVQEEKTEYEAHVEALEATVSAKSAELRSLSEEIAALEATIDANTVEMDALRETLKAMEKEKANLEENLQHLEEQVELHKLSDTEQTAQPEASHEGLLKRVQDMTLEIERLHEAAEANAHEEKVLQETVRGKESAMKILQDECATLTSKLETASKDLSTRTTHFEGVVTQKDEVIRELQDQLAILSDRSSDLESDVRDLREQLLMKERDIATVSESLEQLATLRTEVEESRIAIMKRDETGQELQIELDSLRARCTEFESRIDELCQQLAEKEKQTTVIQDLEEQLAELNELVKDHEASLSVKDETLRNLEEQRILLSEQRAQLETQVDELTTKLQSKGDDENAVAALEEKVSALEAELRETVSSAEHKQTAMRQELGELEASVSQKDEVIGKLKTKMEDVLGMYKKLKEHAQDLQERLAEKSTEAASRKDEIDSMLQTHERLSEELAAAKQVSKALKDALESSKRDQEQLTTTVTSELSAKNAELEAMKVKYEEVNVRLSSQEEELTKEITELRESKTVLIKTVEEKVVDHQHVEEQLKELQTRHDEMKLLHQQVVDESSRLKSELEETCAKIAKLKKEHSGIGAVHEELTTKLQEEIASLRAQLDMEIEGANAARTALELYKKRAATALKKATHESKSSIKKVEEETTQLQQDFAEATAKIAALEDELSEAQKQLDEAHAVSAAQIRAIKEKADEEKARSELLWKKALESVEAQLVSLRAELDAKSHLDVRIFELEELNLSLAETVDNLKKEVQQKSEVAREMMKVKDGEIAKLTKQMEDAKRAANEAAEQLKSALVSSNGAPSSVYDAPKEGTGSPRRSSAEHEHLAAAMADVQSSISMTVTTSGGSTNGVDGQILKLARTQAMRDEESSKTKLQLQNLEEQVRSFQKKYEDTLALLEELTRQKRRLQELSTRTTDGLNIEYLKNVVIKYIESQNPSEKDRLIPVIATVLHFSPQEMKKINDAHQKAHEEAGGLLGGVFSLFGAAPAAPPPKPLAIPPNLNLKQPSPGSMTSPGTDQDDDDDQLTPLNPFASNSY